MGYKERVTMPQIKQFLLMDSHDELRAKAEKEVNLFFFFLEQNMNLLNSFKTS